MPVGAASKISEMLQYYGAAAPAGAHNDAPQPKDAQHRRVLHFTSQLSGLRFSQPPSGNFHI